MKKSAKEVKEKKRKTERETEKIVYIKRAWRCNHRDREQE